MKPLLSKPKEESTASVFKIGTLKLLGLELLFKNQLSFFEICVFETVQI